MAERKTEVWLSGPVEGIPPLVQPIAHSLLQVSDEIESIMDGFPPELLWARPAGVASAGFHLRHMRGVVDRLFTYARGEQLDDEQREALAAEKSEPADVSAAGLIREFRAQVETALAELRATDEATLTEHREVGRARLPSTVLGLFSHAAEHCQRHMGQLLVTVRVQHPRDKA